MRLLLIFLIAIFLCAPTSAKDNAWTLDQFSEQSGKQTTLITWNALKTINHSTHLTTVAMAPSWRIITYSDRNKRYYETTYDAWNGAMTQRIAFMFGEDIPKKDWKLDALEQVACRQTKKYSVVHDRYSGDNFMGQTHVRKRFYWLAADLPVSVQVANILSRLLGFPEMDRIPIKYAGLQTNGELLLALTTFKVSATKVDSSIRYPDLRGYQKIKTESDFNTDSGRSNDDLKNLFGH